MVQEIMSTSIRRLLGSLTYFKQLSELDVTIDPEEIFGESVNGTRLESYFFTLQIMKM